MSLTPALSKWLLFLVLFTIYLHVPPTHTEMFALIDPILHITSITVPICLGKREYRLACERCGCNKNDEIRGCQDRRTTDPQSSTLSLPTDETCERRDHGNCYCADFEEWCKQAEKWKIEDEEWTYYQYLSKLYDEKWLYYQDLKKLVARCDSIGRESGSGP